jgi:hypothetical protein
MPAARAAGRQARFRQVDPDEQRAMIRAQRMENGAEILRRIGWSASDIRQWREQHPLPMPVDIDD